MEKKNRYFLVVRDRNTQDFLILPIQNEWGSSLEKIDLYTMSFYEEEFKKNLLKEGKIQSHNIDFFIVNSLKDSTLNIQEVLFHSHVRIQDITFASLEGRILDRQEDIKSLFYEFCTRMRNDQSFYDSIVYGKTSLYPKFVRYFLEKRFQNSYSVFYRDGGWILKSYPLIRNIEESLGSTYVSLKDQQERSLLEKKLLMMTAPHYHPEQLLLFDFLEDASFEAALDIGVENGREKVKRKRRA